MPNVAPPLVVAQDLADAAEEELREMGAPVPAAIKQLQAQLSEQALREAAADAIKRVGLTDHTRELIRGMGWEVRRLR